MSSLPNARTAGYRLSSEPPLRARIAGYGDELPVIRLSPIDLSFVPLRSGAPTIGEELEIAICSEEQFIGPLACQVVATSPMLPLFRHEVTARLLWPKVEEARNILALLRRLRLHQAASPVTACFCDEEVIEDRARIRSLLASLFANRSRAIVRSAGQGQGTWSRSACLTPDYRILVEWESNERPVAPPLEIEIGGFYCDYRFLITRPLNHNAGGLPTPSRVVKIRRRFERRALCPPRTMVSFAHPHWPERVVHRSVREVSPTGLSFETVLVDDLLYPGLNIEPLLITWKRGQTVELRGTVRHVSPGIHGHGDTCGLAIDSGFDADLWHAEIGDLLHPHTRIGQPWYDDVWDVYAASGYLEMSDKEVDDFAPLRAAFVEVNTKLAAAPGLGCQITWPTRERVEATISMLKVWQHSYLDYQLARYNEGRPLWVSGNDILRDIYLHAYEHVQTDPDLGWHVIYVQDSGHFSRMAHLDFTLRYADGERACVLPMRAWEGRCQGLVSSPPLIGIDIGAPSKEELSSLLDAIAQTRPPAYLEANDLVAERFDLRGIKAQWKSAGLLRDRGVLVARREGVAVAGAVLELAEDGLHLYGLLDLVRLFPLDEEGPRFFPALLNAARDWYRAHGKAKFVYFDEAFRHEHAHAAGLYDLGGASLIIVCAELVPDMLEHVMEVIAPNPRGRLAG